MNSTPRHLKDPTNVPSGGWKALQPETGTIIKAPSFQSLISAVRKYRGANNLPVEPNLRRQVEIQVCNTLPPEEADRLCKYLREDDRKNPEKLRAFRSRTEDLRNFALAVKGVIQSAARGVTLHVSAETANERASICAQCPFNLPVANCWSCGTLGSLYREILGHKKTAADPLLKSCDVCGCDNKTQVHFSNEVHAVIASKRGLAAEEFPDWCWKKEALKPA